MKFHEAIDMIMDGGTAYSAAFPNQRFWFDEYCLDDNTVNGPRISRDDVKATDWLVEKDGVVYEEKIKIKATTGKVTEEEIFEKMSEAMAGGSNPIFNLKPIIAEEVNEDWLEKKMLCFQDRLRTVPGLERTHTTDAKCQNDGCQFCFPQEQPEETILPAESVILYTCTHGTHPNCEKCWKRYQENQAKPAHIPDASKMVEDVREKVTIEQMNWLLIDLFKALDQAGNKDLRQEKRDWWQKIFANRKIYFTSKLEYLVSLQEKA